MHPEVEEQKQKIKEILYDCAVEIRATKAALYLSDGGGRYELVTEYGFRSTARVSLDTNDPIVDRCGRGRNAFFINGLTAEPRFSERLYEASSERLLAVPIYSRGQLVGMIDMRDKQAKAPFEQSDIPKGQGIAARIAELFSNKNVFGQRFITLSESGEGGSAAVEQPPNAAPQLAPPPSTTPTPTPRPSAAPAAAPPLRAPEPPPARRTELPQVANLVLEARQAVNQRVNVAALPDTLNDTDLSAARDVLRIVLLLPGVVIASFSAFGHLGGVQEVVSKAPIGDEAMRVFEAKLNIWMKKRGENAASLKTNVQTPFGTSGQPVRSDQLVKVLTAPVVVGTLSGLALTVAFETAPDRQTHEMLAAFHAQLQIAIEQSISRSAVGALRWRAAGKLLEPDFQHYPELRNHSAEVTARAEDFAKFLALSAAEVENVRLVATLHDVGMRLLEYERLYRKYDLSPDEVGILREHPSVGAAIVEPVFGRELARAVLSHHERMDGAGYPHQIHGDDIPLLSRIVQICDAYEAMVSTDSYQPPQSRDAAISTLALGAGTQFDRELVQRFQELMRTR
ncbi:MAG: hypothetical protein QOI24_3398 [Acidobacteriota bacterium]|nr:hypothetical protein [Acidobacteriota bacterium]